MSDFKKAVETVTMGLAVEPRNKDLLAMKSRCGQLRRAVQSLRRAQALQGRRYSGCIQGIGSGPRSRLGNSSLQQQFEQVKQMYEKAEKSRKMGLSPLERIKEQGDEKYKNGMFEEAIALYTKCIDKGQADGDVGPGYQSPEQPRRVLQAALQLRHRRRTSVLEVEPDNVKALVRRAQAFEAVERYKLALQDVKYVISLGVNGAGMQNYKLCNQMQSRLQKVIDKLKSGDF